MKHNMQILQELAAKNGPLCVGLDTDPSYIPQNLVEKFSPAQAVLEYNKLLIKKSQRTKAPAALKSRLLTMRQWELKDLKFMRKL